MLLKWGAPDSAQNNKCGSIQTQDDFPGEMSGTEKVPQRTFATRDFAELSGELSGAICLKTFVLMGNDR